nr:hypothetical protein [Tanacetum cinerariifolium]
EDLNLKFLRSLPSEWNTHVMVWMNKYDLDTMSIDYIYNNFKIVKQEVKRMTSTNSSSQNIAFVSSPSPLSTIEVATDFRVSTASPQVSTSNLSDATMYAFLANQPNGSQLMYEDLEQIHEDDLEEIDLKWQLVLLSMRAKRVLRNQENRTRNQETTRRTVNVEDTSSKAIVAIDKAGFNWSYMTDDETPTNMAFMAFSDSETSSVKISKPVKENHDAPLTEDWESEREDEVESPPEIERKTVKPSMDKVEVDIPNQNDKPDRRPIKYAEKYKTQRHRGNQRNWNNLKSHHLGNISYLTDVKEFDGGYVAFGGGAKGGNIIGKRIIRTDSKLPTTFWAEVVNTACYVQNRVLVVKPHFKTPYELFRDKIHALSFMRPFGCHVTILNTLDYLGKFDEKSDERFFVGYSTNSKAFRVYNTRTRKVEENLHINFLENKPIITGNGPKWLFDINALTESMNYVPVIAGTNFNDFIGKGANFDADDDNKDNDGPCKDSEIDNQERPNAENSTKDVNTAGPSINTASLNMNTANLLVNTVRQSDDFFSADNDMTSLDRVEVDISNISTTYPVPTTPNTRIHKDHSVDNVIGDMQSGVQTRRMTVTTDEQGFISVIYKDKTHEDLYTCLFACFLSQEEPKMITSTLKDPAWVEAMQEELLQFHLQKVWTLVYLPRGKRDIGTKWVFRNKKDERGIVIRNKARIEEEVYVCQPLGFGDSDYPNKFYKVENALYGLHQAPRACYETLAMYLLDNRFQRDGIFISQDKYVDEILRKFKYAAVKPASTPMDKEKALLKDSDGNDVDVYLYRSMIGSLMYLTSSRPDIMFVVCLWYPRDSPFDLVAYTDSDYAGASLDRKSTPGGCQFLGCRLISWQCKKQTMVATSTTEAEYVAAASCCGQVL